MPDQRVAILNPGSAAAERDAARIAQLAQRSGCTLYRPSEPSGVAEAVRRALEAGCPRLIVAGGDGTVSRVVNMLSPEAAATELAVVPLGTGNDLARALGMDIECRETAWAQAMDGPAVPIDLIRVSNGETSLLVNAANGGMGGFVAADVDREEKSRWGAFAYWLGAISRLSELQEFDIQLELNGESIELNGYGVVVANGRFVGGGFPMAPRALLNDGLLDVTLIPALPALDLLAAGLDFRLGRDDAAGIRTYRSTRVSVQSTPELPFSIDGEPAHSRHADFVIAPGAANVVIGENPLAVQPEIDPARHAG